MNDEHASQIASVNESVAAAANDGNEPARPLKINPVVARKAAQLAKEYAERDVRIAFQNIKYQTEQILREREKAEKAKESNEEQADLWCQAWTLLAKGKFHPREIDWARWRIQVDTTEKKLAKLAKLIGRLDMDNADKEVADAAKRTVKITAYSIKYPFVKVVWEHTLTEKDKCRIEEEVVPAKVQHNLVCDVNKE